LPYSNKNIQKNYLKKYHQQNKEKYNQRQNTYSKIGTTDFKQAMCKKEDNTPDFEREQEEINKEKQRIKKQYNTPPWANYWVNDETREIEDHQTLQHEHAILDFIPKILVEET